MCARPASAGLSRLSPYGAATLLSAFALRLGLACGYGLHLGVVFCSLAADLFSTAVFVFEHGKFSLLISDVGVVRFGDSEVAYKMLR